MCWYQLHKWGGRGVGREEGVGRREWEWRGREGGVGRERERMAYLLHRVEQ